MLTLAKRPQPQLGTAPTTRTQYTEEDYAKAIKRLTRSEGHRPQRIREPNVDRFDLVKLIIADGAKKTVDIAAKRGVSYEVMHRELCRLEKRALIKRTLINKINHWSLIC
jgi:hypothetical protein